MASDMANSIGSWIPQVFYDLIGRIVPGFLVMIILGVVVHGPSGFWIGALAWLSNKPEQRPSTTIVLLLGVVLAYGMSICLRGVYYGLQFFLHRASKWKFLGWIVARSLPPDFARKYDFIRIANSAAGSRIAKLNAEEHMVGVLQMGTLLGFVLNALKMESWSDERTWLAAFLLLGLVGLECQKRHFRKRRGNAVVYHADLLNYQDKEDPELKEQHPRNAPVE